MLEGLPCTITRWKGIGPRKRRAIAFFGYGNAGRVGLFGIVAHFRPDFTFEDIGDGDSRMVVRGRAFSRRVGNFHGGNRPSFDAEVRQIVLEHTFSTCASGLAFEIRA